MVEPQLLLSVCFTVRECDPNPQIVTKVFVFFSLLESKKSTTRFYQSQKKPGTDKVFSRPDGQKVVGILKQYVGLIKGF